MFCRDHSRIQGLDSLICFQRASLFETGTVGQYLRSIDPTEESEDGQSRDEETEDDFS